MVCVCGGGGCGGVVWCCVLVCGAGCCWLGAAVYSCGLVCLAVVCCGVLWGLLVSVGVYVCQNVVGVVLWWTVVYCHVGVWVLPGCNGCPHLSF